jgi:hypothetical protein
MAYARVSARDDFDVEAAKPRAAPLRALFGAGGPAPGAPGGKPQPKPKPQPRLAARVQIAAPRVGALLVAAAAAAAASAPLLVPVGAVLGAGFVAVQLSAVVHSIATIEVAVSRAAVVVGASGANTHGVSYIDSLGTGAESLAAIADDLHRSGLAAAVGDIDFKAFSHLAQSAGDADLPRLARDAAKVLEELHTLHLQANLQFQPGPPEPEPPDGVAGRGARP